METHHHEHGPDIGRNSGERRIKMVLGTKMPCQNMSKLDLCIYNGLKKIMVNGFVGDIVGIVGIVSSILLCIKQISATYC